MLFNSFEFCLFFPIVVGVYFALPQRFRWVQLLLASYLFYMAWEPAYALLIGASTLIDWFAARAMPGSSPARRRALLGVSLVFNLGLLFSFKYYELARVTLGNDWLPASAFLLPVGISFYTFQTLGYTIDVYRGQQEPEPHLGRFALYVSFWPQLVAGPIERAGRLLPQLRAHHRFDAVRVASGLRRMVWGLFKKVVVADRVALIADAAYGNPTAFGGAGVALGTLAFGYQVYCDFSGYTDIALGAAKVMGFDLMENFDQPHLASSIRDYWARWHLSLSSWFRDYVFIPLGGSRVNVLRHGLNLLIVFWLCGMWHGAAWHFGMWGAINALYLWVGKHTASRRRSLGERVGLASVPRLWHGYRVVSTFFLVYLGYTFFRAEDLGHWWVLVQQLVDWSDPVADIAALQAHMGMAGPVMVATLLLMPLTDLITYVRRDPRLLERVQGAAWPVRHSLDYALVLSTLALGNYNATAFFYFQF
jgi:alginate O-acetyltransferase complex protein AlgI